MKSKTSVRRISCILWCLLYAATCLKSQTMFAVPQSLSTSRHCIVLMPKVTLSGASINFCQWCFKCLHRQSYQGKCEQTVGTARAAPRLPVL